MMQLARILCLTMVALSACSDSNDGAPPPGNGLLTVCPIAAQGRCNGNVVEFCAMTTGDASMRILAHRCASDEVCERTDGPARCVLTGQCASGATECQGTQLATCVAGSWQLAQCANGCVGSELGANCSPGGGTYRYEGVLSYMAKNPTSNLTDWDQTPTQLAAPGFLILSIANGLLLDSTLTSTRDEDPGAFSINAVPPEQVDGDDYLLAVTARGNDQQKVLFLVSKSGFTSGTQDVTGQPPAPDVWAWRWSVRDSPSGGVSIIPVESGSGAAFVFNYLSFVYDAAVKIYSPSARSPLIVWLDLGVDWNCGACMGPWPYRHSDGNIYESQIWFSAGASEGFWSGAVLAHELGHYVMNTYGASPGEGGQHMIGQVSHPGLAYSEGFATWFSSVVRDDPRYYDKQQGVFFWLDISRRSYSGPFPWNRPKAADGLEQMIDENEISAMLWALTNEQTFQGLLSVIATPRLTQSPFLRGYKRRQWNGLNQDYLPLPFQSTTISAPYFADYLDAVNCSGVIPAATIDQVTSPNVNYPYPSNAPLCRASGAPLDVEELPGGIELTWHMALAGDLVVVEGQRELLRVPAGTKPASRWVETSGGKVTVRTGRDGDVWGAAWTSTEPQAPSAPEMAQPIKIGSTVIRPIQLRPTPPNKGGPARLPVLGRSGNRQLF